MLTKWKLSKIRLAFSGFMGLSMLLICLSIGSPASAQVTIGGSWPVSPAPTFVVNGHMFTVSFLGATTQVAQDPSQSYFETMFTYSHTVSGTNLWGFGAGVIGVASPPGSGGVVYAPATSSTGNSLAQGYGVAASGGGQGVFSGSASVSGGPFFVYQVTTDGTPGQDGNYSMGFAHASTESAFAGAFGPPGALADGNATNYESCEARTGSGSVQKSFPSSGPNAGKLQIDFTNSCTAAITNGIGYFTTGFPIVCSSTLSSPVAAGDGATATAREEVEPYVLLKL